MNDSKINDGGPAFPRPADRDDSGAEGMSIRAYAAIKLRVPESGIEWLDEMIRKAKRDEGVMLGGIALWLALWNDWNTHSRSEGDTP